MDCTKSCSLDDFQPLTFMEKMETDDMRTSLFWPNSLPLQTEYDDGIPL